MHNITIETERLILRPLTVKDAEAVLLENLTVNLSVAEVSVQSEKTAFGCLGIIFDTIAGAKDMQLRQQKL